MESMIYPINSQYLDKAYFKSKGEQRIKYGRDKYLEDKDISNYPHAYQLADRFGVEYQGDEWGGYNVDPLSRIISDFHRVISRDEFEDLLESMRQNNSYAIELAGPGGFLREAGLSGLALSLYDGRTEQEKSYQSSMGISLIEGNIIFINTWDAISEYIDSKEKKPKMIFANAIHGWHTLPKDVNLFVELFTRTFKFLDKDGVLLTDLPRTDEEDSFRIDKLSSTFSRRMGFEYYRSSGYLYVKKLV